MGKKLIISIGSKTNDSVVKVTVRLAESKRVFGDGFLSTYGDTLRLKDDFLGCRLRLDTLYNRRLDEDGQIAILLAIDHLPDMECDFGRAGL